MKMRLVRAQVNTFILRLFAFMAYSAFAEAYAEIYGDNTEDTSNHGH